MNNFLKIAYENFWVPVLGRLLMKFSSFIEGKDLRDAKQTYDLKTNEENHNDKN